MKHFKERRGPLGARNSNKKDLNQRSFLSLRAACALEANAMSGEGGIRTHGGHRGHNGFRDRPFQPLRHLSERPDYTRIRRNWGRLFQRNLVAQRGVIDGRRAGFLQFLGQRPGRIRLAVDEDDFLQRGAAGLGVTQQHILPGVRR